MRRNYTMLTLRLILIGMIGLGLIGLTGCGDAPTATGAQGTTATTTASTITLTAGDTNLVADGTQKTTLTATVMDSNSNLLSDMTVTFATSIGDFDSEAPGPQVITTSKTKNGVATATIRSTVLGTANVTATVGNVSGTATVTFVAGDLANISVVASPNSLIADGSSTSTITATVTDVQGHPVADGWNIDFAVTTGTGTIITATAPTTNGIATATYTSSKTPGTETVTASNAEMSKSGTADIALISIPLKSMTLSVTSPSIVADSVSQTAIRATLINNNNNPVQGITVGFKSSFGALSEDSAITNANGVAVVMLTSDKRTGVALVSATTSAPVAGFSDQQTVTFVPGFPDDAHSSITADKISIPPDGTSTTTVTVTLADENGNPVANGTKVNLYTTAGTISSANPATIASGRATFELKAASKSGTATLSLPDYPDITSQKVTFGSTVSTGNPASIIVDSIAHSEIAVTGVGQNDNTAVTVRIVDETGVTVEDTNEDTKYFLTISLLARPEGGEIIGGELEGAPLSNNQKISVSTTAGQATFNLRSGTLPGVVEVRIEVTTKDDTVTPATYNNSLSPPVVTVIPQISIASGPPQTIALSAPTMNAVVNLNNGPDSGIPQNPGFYSRTAGLIVTDQYGNAVPDGTVVNLGLIDTVIASSITGKTEGNSNELKDVGGIIDFTKARVTRNGAVRSILPHDRVVIFNANAVDKSRFVSDTKYLTDILYMTKNWWQDPEDTDNNIITTNTNLNYAVGSSLLGGAIFGIDNSGAATKGTVTTQNGLAELRLVYPANKDTIHNGAYAIGTDTRFNTPKSARVISVFTSSDGGATLVNEGKLVFSSIVPWALTAVPTATSTSTTVGLTLVDGGDKIRLPFISVTASIVITSASQATPPLPTPLVVTATTGATDASGSFTSTITVTVPGVNPGDKAVITYYAGDATATVTYTQP